MIFVLGFVAALLAALASWLANKSTQKQWSDTRLLVTYCLICVGFYGGAALMLWSIGTLAWRYLP